MGCLGIELKERWVVAWLLFCARAQTQSVRVLLGALMPYIAEELRLTPEDKGRILASFAGGYMLTQVAGGYFGDRVGGRLPMLVAMSSMALGVLLAPALADAFGAAGLAACFFVMGFCEGPSYPCCGAMLGRWIPAHERSKAISIADTGSSIGSMLTYGVAPALASLRGWRAAMQLWGYGAGLVAFVWWLRATSGPDECGHLSMRELEYLRSHGLGRPPTRAKASRREGRFPVALFAYPAAWATMVAHSAFNFGRYFVYNSLVTFYVEQLGTTAVAAGQHILVGQIADALGKFGFAPFADAAIRRRPDMRTKVRKVISGGAFIAFAGAMCGLAGCGSVAQATAWLVVCKIASSAHVCGFKSSYLDLTTTHAGAFSGVSNTLATVASFLSPLLGGRLLDGSRGGWASMFAVIAGLNVAAAVFWGVFASANSLDDELLRREAGEEERNSPRTVADDVHLLEDVSPKSAVPRKNVAGSV